MSFVSVHGDGEPMARRATGWPNLRHCLLYSQLSLPLLVGKKRVLTFRTCDLVTLGACKSVVCKGGGFAPGGGSVECTLLSNIPPSAPPQLELWEALC